ncbi:hypothetical protein KL86DES1_22030 [uncultured Desulfovibrio sp.]|uniref:Uncharacterized protein n=1 Tax=uncultured Desulfovibrio sp. TaxID=167968 RepID=A0A212LAM7_9BACT|nr:hypothetical protein KL86DES1_22030 [uncultured Desulfovibrio sp.]VZH34924.1 conserved protein of unknown function [Desulfovibrio sp. 86]
MTSEGLPSFIPLHERAQLHERLDRRRFGARAAAVSEVLPLERVPLPMTICCEHTASLKGYVTSLRR